MQVVMLAGGSVTPAGRGAEQVPASLLMLEGRPLIDWQLDDFVTSGARSVVMCVGYQGEQVEAHVKRALDRGLVVSYSYDGAERVGSGGALRRAFARLDETFVVVYAERYLPFAVSALLDDLQAHPEAVGCVAVAPRGPESRAGNAAVDAGWVVKYEQSSAEPALDFVACGALALRRSALAGVEDGAVWGLGALLRKLARQRQLRAFVSPEQGLDVGSHEGRRGLEQRLAGRSAGGVNGGRASSPNR